MATILVSVAPVGESDRNEKGSAEESPVLQGKNQRTRLSQTLTVLGTAHRYSMRKAGN